MKMTLAPARLTWLTHPSPHGQADLLAPGWKAPRCLLSPDSGTTGLSDSPILTSGLWGPRSLEVTGIHLGTRQGMVPGDPGGMEETAWLFRGSWHRSCPHPTSRASPFLPAAPRACQGWEAEEERGAGRREGGGAPSRGRTAGPGRGEQMAATCDCQGDPGRLSNQHSCSFLF